MRYIELPRRYPDTYAFSTARDPFDDLVLHLEFLTARDSAAELLRQRLERDDVAELAAMVASHARLASSFLKQAAASPDTVAFVPAYYASLNLAKVCVLFSPEHGPSLPT